MDIETIEKVAAEIANFNDCYEDIKLHGDRFDNGISANKLIEFLIDNPHLQQIADKIAKLKS